MTKPIKVAALATTIFLNERRLATVDVAVVSDIVRSIVY